MKKITLGKSDLQTGAISLGCMRMHRLSVREAQEVIENALEVGVDLFDHADIYGDGASEEMFSQALKAIGTGVRDKLILQTKCGIRKGFYDFSREHILQSVEGSLRRLNTDYIDILLLHRPDVLMEPEEVAEAFHQLHESGKVRFFGVSNHHPMQIELLQKALKERLIVNQLQLSLVHTPLLDASLHVNMLEEGAVVRDGLALDYCRLNDITVQAWSPFQHGMIEGVFLNKERYSRVNTKLQELSEKYDATVSALAIAWILRHPAGIQPIVGTMNPQRLREIAPAARIKLSREDWYALYTAAGNTLP